MSGGQVELLGPLPPDIHRAIIGNGNGDLAWHGYLRSTSCSVVGFL